MAKADTQQAERTLRAYRRYLAGCALSFEQGWTGLHQVLATRPAAHLANTPIASSQSLYPFRRDYM